MNDEHIALVAFASTRVAVFRATADRPLLVRLRDVAGTFSRRTRTAPPAWILGERGAAGVRVRFVVVDDARCAPAHFIACTNAVAAEIWARLLADDLHTPALERLALAHFEFPPTLGRAFIAAADAATLHYRVVARLVDPFAWDAATRAIADTPATESAGDATARALVVVRAVCLLAGLSYDFFERVRVAARAYLTNVPHRAEPDVEWTRYGVLLTRALVELAALRLDGTFADAFALHRTRVRAAARHWPGDDAALVVAAALALAPVSVFYARNARVVTPRSFVVVDAHEPFALTSAVQRACVRPDARALGLALPPSRRVADAVHTLALVAGRPLVDGVDVVSAPGGVAAEPALVHAWTALGDASLPALAYALDTAPSSLALALAAEVLFGVQRRRPFAVERVLADVRTWLVDVDDVATYVRHSDGTSLARALLGTPRRLRRCTTPPPLPDVVPRAPVAAATLGDVVLAWAAVRTDADVGGAQAAWRRAGRPRGVVVVDTAPYRVTQTLGGVADVATRALRPLSLLVDGLVTEALCNAAYNYITT